MDEQEERLAGLFREAASGAPPPGFDVQQVVATSRRITRRRRSAVAGAALAVLAVAGVGVTAGLGGGSGTEMTTASAGGAPAPEAAGDQGGAARAAAPAPPAAAAAAPAPLGPAPRTEGCDDKQDPALRALVEQVLPEVVGAPEGPVKADCTMGGSRGLSVELGGPAAPGVLVVEYLPPGASTEGRSSGVLAPTASGGTVQAYSWATRHGDPPPVDDARIAMAVAALAPLL